jgi:hypothetical protein
LTVSSINYAQLAGGGNVTPPDGLHNAYLMRARLQTGAQDFLVTEWQAGTFYWETLYGFTANRIRFAQDALDGLGIDRSKITNDDALEDALYRVQGGQFQVRTEVNGNFVNTYVEGPVSARFEDMPADTSGLPDVSAPPAQPAQAPLPVGAPAAAEDDEDDIPF